MPHLRRRTPLPPTEPHGHARRLAAPGPGLSAPGTAAATQPRDPAELRAAALRWFAGHRRPLPGREIRDPWRVLVVEVMSQQTQIERSLFRAEGFCEQFPAPDALARASVADVVRAWAGLGYNRRALALRDAARVIVERHGGRVPSDLSALVALPGVGPYTARAVAARAHGVAIMPIDVNVRRVLSRLTGTARPAAMQALGDAIAGAPPATDTADAPSDTGAADPAGTAAGAPPVSTGTPAPGPTAHPGDVADTLMDLAAGVCHPRDPSCDACPLRPWCAWHARPAAATPDPDGIACRPARGRRREGSRVPFRETRRWLRGQLLRELREQRSGAWSSIEGDRGAHGHTAVREVLATLVDEGFVELDERGRARLAED